MSKRISLIILAVIIMLVMVIPSNKVFAVSNKKVTSVNAFYENGKLTVSGEVEAGMLAVAVQVYDQNDQFVKLETGAVNSQNKYEVVFTIPEGIYTVKVADFDGGEVVTKKVNEEVQDNQKEDTKEDKTEESETSSNPKTGDNIIMFVSIFAVATLGVFITIKLNRKRKVSKH